MVAWKDEAERRQTIRGKVKNIHKSIIVSFMIGGSSGSSVFRPRLTGRGDGGLPWLRRCFFMIPRNRFLSLYDCNSTSYWNLVAQHHLTFLHYASCRRTLTLPEQIPAEGGASKPFRKNIILHVKFVHTGPPHRGEHTHCSNSRKTHLQTSRLASLCSAASRLWHTEIFMQNTAFNPIKTS